MVFSALHKLIAGSADDRPQDLQLQVTRISALLGVVLTSAFTLYSLTVPLSTPQRMGAVSAAGFCMLGGWLALRGQRRWAALLITGSAWVVVVITALWMNPEGVFSSSFTSLSLLILFAGATLGPRAALVVACLSSASGLWSVLALPPGILNPVGGTQQTVLMRWVEQSLYFFGTAIFLSVVMSRLVRVLIRLQRSEISLAERNRQLEAQIAERQQVEAVLRQQADHLQMALRAGHMRVWSWDFSTSRIHARNMGATFPLLDEDYSLSDFYALVHPDDRERIKEHVDRCISQRLPYQVECRASQEDGQVRWLLAVGGVRMDDSGAAVGMSGIVQDITDLKRAQQDIRRLEERFYKAFHANPIPIAITTDDDDAVYIDVNERWAEMFGYELGELVGKSALSVETWVNPDDLRRLQARFRAEGQVREIEVWRKTRSGQSILVRTAIEPIELGEDGYWLVMLEDVTERKRADQQALELTMARERVTVLRDFLSTMSHDLKTPLTVMNTSLDLLERTHDPQRRREKADIIRAQVSLINRYIQDTLTIARLDYTPDLTIDTLQLAPLIQGVEQRLRTRIEDKQQSYSVEIAPNLPDVRGDGDELERALLNLVENAVNYTPPGGRIAVRVERVGAMAHIEIQDSGIGIAPGEQLLVFERFYRSSAGKQAHLNGTGLGLAIVKRIIEMHGGRIELVSAVGKGSVFHLWLPVVSSTDDDETLPASAIGHLVLRSDSPSDS